MRLKKTALLLILVMISAACAVTNMGSTPTPVRLGPAPSLETQVILQRLDIEFLGLDGHKLIGSGCPGVDGKGSIENNHFVVRGVNIDSSVQRILVAGDNSTLTWAWPCSDAWGLLAEERERGTWDIFTAPSLPTKMYTIIFFYDDNTIALGMVEVP